MKVQQVALSVVVLPWEVPALKSWPKGLFVTSTLYIQKELVIHESGAKRFLCVLLRSLVNS